MSNGEEFLDDAALEETLRDMEDRKVIEFAVRQIYKQSRNCASCQKRVSKLEAQNRKNLGLGVTVGGAVAAAMATLFGWTK